MKRMYRWIGLGLLAAGLTGCVSQDQYKALKLDRDQLAERLAQADSDAGRAKAEADLLKKQLEAINSAQGTGGALVANLSAQNAELTKRLEDLNQKYLSVLQS